MKSNHAFAIIFGVAAILLTAATAISYLMYEAGRARAHKEKWEEYIDCGRA